MSPRSRRGCANQWRRRIGGAYGTQSAAYSPASPCRRPPGDPDHRIERRHVQLSGTSDTVVRIANTGRQGATDSISDPAGDRLGTKTGSTVAWLTPTSTAPSPPAWPRPPPR